MNLNKIKFKDIILFEDKDYLILNKPYSVSTLEDRSSPVNMLKMAKEYCQTAQVCHRLDKETSGVLAFAKNEKAYRHLNMQFEKREVNKIYHAVIEGVSKYEYDMFSAPIKILKKGIAKIDTREGKESHTIFNTIETYKFHSLLECNPITGRLHQIRIHLATMEHPIVGDTLYGGRPLYLSQYKRKFNIGKHVEESPLMSRVALHAYSLKFSLLNGDQKIVEADYPKDFNAMVNQMKKYS